jgi:Tol biopolymer transport system component
VPDLKLRQLTTNSSENPVTSGAISPDGNYLAYTDMKGMHIKVIETGETRVVPQAEELKNDNVKWEILSTFWFPDSASFLVNAHPASEEQSAWSSQTSSIWMVPVQGGAPRRLRGDAFAWSVSPENSSIAFSTNKGKLGDREMWLMSPTGQQAHKIFDTDENSMIGVALWSPDGQRIIYLHSDGAGDTFLSRDLKGGLAVTVLTPSETKNMYDNFWSPDGEFIYSLKETQMTWDNCNYWAMRLDPRTGKPIEKPRRLTNWAGFCMDNTNVTADGQRLAFRKWSTYASTYVADLKPGGTQILTTRHFTLSTTFDAPGDWTADSKAIILASNRTGHWGFYKQALNEDEPVPLVTGPDGLRNSRVSPDGKWVLYVQEVRHGAALTWDATSPIQIMRVPITGGTSQLVFTARPRGRIACAKAPSKLCVIEEPTEDRKQMVVTAFDPLEGRGPELAKFDVGPNPDSWGGELSPDGTRIAALAGPGGHISILSLRGRSTKVIKVSGCDNLQVVSWAADGKSLFVLNGVNQKLAILNVDLLGNAHLLRDKVGASDLPASPDGRHLAFMSQTMDGNMWMMENF